MRLLLCSGLPQHDHLVWLSRATTRTIALAPGVLLSLDDGENVVRSEDGHWYAVVGPGTDHSGLRANCPEELARATPGVSFDKATATLALIAHPLGRGTFFHTRVGRSIFASTSIADVVECCECLRPNARLIADYFTSMRNRGVDLTDTFVEGVSQVAPGYEAIWTGSQLVLCPRWTPLEDAANGSLDTREAALHVRRALERVVVRHVSPSTACLVSGGLDSSTVAGIATRLSNSCVPLVTYGHGLDSPREALLRDALSRHLDTGIRVLPLRELGFSLDAVRRANRGANSPSGGLFSGIFAEILESARTYGFDTVLTGEGGDEVFDHSPDLLTDLARAHRWGALLNALSFFASYRYETSAARLLLEYVVSPCATSAGLRWPRPRRDAFLFEVLGSGFRPTLQDAQDRAWNDLKRAAREGWNLTTYYNYRQVLDLPVYEPVDLHAHGKPVRVVSPLGSIEVFRAANSQRIDQLAGAWLGFRSKRLLALAAADVLPYEVAYGRKTGIGNLLSRLVGRTDRPIEGDIDLTIVSRIGIDVSPKWLDPNAYPTQRSLVWALLLNLCTWFHELEELVRERIRLPVEDRIVSDL